MNEKDIVDNLPVEEDSNGNGIDTPFLAFTLTDLHYFLDCIQSNPALTVRDAQLKGIWLIRISSEIARLTQVGVVGE